MFRIENAQGQTVYRTDIHSRWQIGRGRRNPRRRAGTATPRRSTGPVSCSVVIDQDVVRAEFEPTTAPPEQISDDEFWATRIHARPARSRPGSRTWSSTSCTSARSAIRARGPARSPTRWRCSITSRDLGVNAIELLPDVRVLRRPQLGLRRHAPLRHRVQRRRAGQVQALRARVPSPRHRGHPGRRLQPLRPERRAGRMGSTTRPRPSRTSTTGTRARSTDYPSPTADTWTTARPGYTPRFWEEPVRQLFISSAAEFVEEFHVDGLRVDLTQAIHRDNALHANGRGVGNANLFGQKFLREWSRTLRLIRPSVMLIAEDHTGWDAVTKAAGRRRSRLRRDLVRRVLPPPDRRLGHGRRRRAAAPRSRLRRMTGRSRWSSSPRGSGPASSTRSSTTSRTTRPETRAARRGRARSRSTTPPLLGPTREYAEARMPGRGRPVDPLSRHTDVLHGRGDRRPEAMPVRQHRQRARKTCMASGPAPAGGCSATTRT